MTGTRIRSVYGRRVWDSRGRPTVEVDVELSGGAIGRAIAPAGASTGAGEAVEKRDGGAAFGGYDVTGALASVQGDIAEAVVGLDALDQNLVDLAMMEADGTPDKSRLGGNALVAASMATAHAAAASQNMPLWKYLLVDNETVLPVPEVQILGGGAHAGRRVDIQDFMVIPVGARSYVDAIDWVAEVYRAAGQILADQGNLLGVADEGGFWPAFDSNEKGLAFLVKAIERAGFTPGDDIAISLDIAASQFGRGGRYRLGLDELDLDSDGLIELLLGWIDKYPIVAIEDPLGEDDISGFQRFTKEVGGRIAVIGDDLLVTNRERIRRMADVRACNALLVKPNQAGTLTETRAAMDAAKQAGWTTIVSARSGETEDTTIVDLAVGWGTPMLKVGSFARSERMAKWNEGLRIADILGGDGPLPAGDMFPWRGR